MQTLLLLLLPPEGKDLRYSHLKVRAVMLCVSCWCVVKAEKVFRSLHVCSILQVMRWLCVVLYQEHTITSSELVEYGSKPVALINKKIKNVEK